MKQLISSQGALICVDVVQVGLVVVESAVSTGERAALSQGNANTRGMDNGARRGEEGKSHGYQSRFAEHGEETDEGLGE